MSRILNRQDIMVLVSDQLKQIPKEELDKLEGEGSSTLQKIKGICDNLNGIEDNLEFADAVSNIMPSNSFDYDENGLFILDKKEEED